MHVSQTAEKKDGLSLKSWLDSTRTKLKGNQGSFSLFMTRICGRWVAAAAMTHVTAVTVAVTVTDSWFLIHDDLMTHDS